MSVSSSAVSRQTLPQGVVSTSRQAYLDVATSPAIAAADGFGRCRGTFGELLQGVLPEEGRRFLVTLPICQYSTARFTVLPGSRELHVFPKYKQKSRQLAAVLLQYLGMDVGGLLSIQSELPEGKGCASSSADMVATAQAVCSSLRRSVALDQLARIMAQIEPSDGIMYPGVVSFYHREGALREHLGDLPPLTIVGVDEGGKVDTIEFNARPRVCTEDEQREYQALLQGMEGALRSQDLGTVGRIATRSAVLNQPVLPKTHLDVMLELYERGNVLGVVTAHSGTYVGVLLSPMFRDYARRLEAVLARFEECALSAHMFHTFPAYCAPSGTGTFNERPPPGDRPHQ